MDRLDVGLLAFVILLLMAISTDWLEEKWREHVHNRLTKEKP